MGYLSSETTSPDGIVRGTSLATEVGGGYQEKERATMIV
jgi:hypothetical protein